MMNKSSPELRSYLRQLDMTTPEGERKAEEILEELKRRNREAVSGCTRKVS